MKKTVEGGLRGRDAQKLIPSRESDQRESCPAHVATKSPFRQSDRPESQVTRDRASVCERKREREKGSYGGEIGITRDANKRLIYFDRSGAFEPEVGGAEKRAGKRVARQECRLTAEVNGANARVLHCLSLSLSSFFCHGRRSTLTRHRGKESVVLERLLG